MVEKNNNKIIEDINNLEIYDSNEIKETFKQTKKIDSLEKENDKNSINIRLYETNNGYISKVNVNKNNFNLKNTKKSTDNIDTIIILDRSGSMGNETKRLFQTIIPEVLLNLNYDMNKNNIHILAFDDQIDDYYLPVKDFPKISIVSRGGTNMLPAVERLENILLNKPTKEYLKSIIKESEEEPKEISKGKKDKNKKIQKEKPIKRPKPYQYHYDKQKENVRILTLSDGELSDTNQTANFCSQLAERLKNSGLNINSQAIRFFTSTSQPDTRGLSSILQFNTQTKANLLDISAKIQDSEIVKLISELFIGDGFDCNSKLVFSNGDINSNDSHNKILKSNLWDKNCVNEISLADGENVFFISSEIINNILLKNKQEEKVQDINNINQMIVDDDVSNMESNIIKFLEKNLYINILDNKFQVKITIQGISDSSEFEKILNTKLEYCMNQLKLLKIINTVNSKEEIQTILNFFKESEDFITKMQIRKNQVTSNESSVKINTHSLKSRVDLYKQMISKKTKSVFNRMNQIANDDKVSQLNSMQQAEYLRSNLTTKYSKSLAKRALHGKNENFDPTDLNGIARKEVLDMKEHIHELKDLENDSSDYLVSFYSTCTTLEGIKSTIELLDDDLIEELTVNDILKMLNLVGIGAHSPVGDYPDPMTYRLFSIYPGCFTSLSDVLTAYEASKGKALVDYSTKKEISNVVPVFEDLRILKFLMKYAPNLLEYTASVGMRRIIANITNTFEYTLLSGIWKFVEVVNTNKSDVCVKLLCCLVRNFEVYNGAQFSHVMEAYDQAKGLNKNSKLSFYIFNNGITNMISPMIKLTLMFFQKIYTACINNQKYEEIDFTYKNIDAKLNSNDIFMKKKVLLTENLTEFIKTHHIPNKSETLRALYSFEIYQVVRKLLKSENPDDTAKEILNDLLGIDISKYSTKIPKLFQINSNPAFHDKYYINENKLCKLIESFWFVDYLTLIPEYLKGVYLNEFFTLGLDTTETNNSIKSTSFNLHNTAIPLHYISKLPEMSETTIEKELQLNCTLKQFKFYNIVQVLLYHTKISRVDDDLREMKILDLQNSSVGEKMVSGYVRSIYSNAYNKELDNKQKTEKQMIVDLLVTKMLQEKNMDNFIKLFKDGISIKMKDEYEDNDINDINKMDIENVQEKISNITFCINDISKLGFSKLNDGLLTNNSKIVEVNTKDLNDLEITGITNDEINDKNLYNDINKMVIEDEDIAKSSRVPLRLEKLRILLLGVDSNKEQVWNNGNCIKTNLIIYEKVFVEEKKINEWAEIKLYIKEFGIHCYRDLENRHGHNNDKPSYWAQGYNIVAELPLKELEEYKTIHTECCGLGPLTYHKQRKLKKNGYYLGKKKIK